MEQNSGNIPPSGWMALSEGDTFDSLTREAKDLVAKLEEIGQQTTGYHFPIESFGNDFREEVDKVIKEFDFNSFLKQPEEEDESKKRARYRQKLDNYVKEQCSKLNLKTPDEYEMLKHKIEDMSYTINEKKSMREDAVNTLKLAEMVKEAQPQNYRAIKETIAVLDRDIAKFEEQYAKKYAEKEKCFDDLNQKVMLPMILEEKKKLEKANEASKELKKWLYKS